MFKIKKIDYLLILLFLSVFIISLFKIYESDAFWHLKSGEYIVKNLSVPKTDPFTINGENKQWANTYWFFEVITYFIYKLSGFTGLIIYKSLVCAITFVVLFNAISLFYSNRTLAFMIIVLFLPIFRERFLVRPDIFSYLFLAIYFYILFLFKYKNISKLTLLPLIMLFWTNFHSGAFFGLILLFIFIIGEGLSETYRVLKNGEVLKSIFIKYKQLIYYSIFSFILFFVSPAHYHSIQYLLNQWNVREIIEISEFKPLLESENHILMAIALIMLIAILGSFRRVPLSLLLPGFIFIIPGIMTRRMSYYAFLVNIPVLVLFIDGLIPRIKLLKISDQIQLIICTILSASILYIKISSDPYHYAGFGVRNIYYPEKHVNFLKQNKLKVNLYNTLNIGGGIIFAGYPEVKAFVDTRIQVNENTLKEIRNAMKSPYIFRSFLNNYNINALLIENKAGLITNNFISFDEWGLVFWDDYSMLLLKRTVEFSEFLKEHEIKIINPETIVLDINGYLTNEALTERVIFHLKRSIVINPECYTAYYSLAYLLRQKEDKNLKEISIYLDKAYRIEPNFIPTLYEIANLYASLRDFYNALYFYKKIIRLEKFYKVTLLYPTIYKEIGMVYLNLREKSKARKFLEKSLLVQPYDEFVIEQLNNM